MRIAISRQPNTERSRSEVGAKPTSPKAVPPRPVPFWAGVQARQANPARLDRPGIWHRQDAGSVMRQVDPEEEEEEPVQAMALVQRQVEPEEEEEEPVQTKAGSGGARTLPASTAAQVHALRGGGRPLPERTRAFMEPRFGRDFSAVRVHTGPAAAESASALRARAYTIGREVAFGAGEYAPDTHAGQKLIAHELTHVVQQCSPQRRSSPPSWTKPETAVSKTGGAQVMRWTQSGDEATVERPLDTLWELARGITDQPRNWACIWPEDIHTPSLFTGQYWRRLQVGDTYDTSNLYNQTGPSETFTFYVRGDPFTETAQYLYGGTRPVNLYQEIGALSRWGGTPIQSLTVCGHTAAHSLLARGAQLGLGLNPEHPRPTSNSALARMGPHRGWFTRNAVVRFVGCTTRHLAAAFARVFLRRGAVALGTTKALCSGEGLLPVELPHTGPMSEAKYSRRRFMFVVPPSGSCADVNQAREILDTKEKVNAAAGLWETIPGQL
jgi:hypothetical protein